MNLLAYPLITYNKYKTFTLERVAIFIFIFLYYFVFKNVIFVMITKLEYLIIYIMLSDAYWIKYPEHNWALIWLSKKKEL